MPEPAAAGMNLDEELAGAYFALQLDKVIAAAETAQLLPAALRSSFAAGGHLPIVVDGNPMALGAAAIESRAILRDVIFSAAANQIIEFAFREIAQAMALRSEERRVGKECRAVR